MQDTPEPQEILETVSALLRAEILPKLDGRDRYAVRVAANALDLVRRELQLAGSSDENEFARLRSIVGADGSLDTLNAQLCGMIESRSIALDDPALIDHLWQTTFEKMAVDQPHYKRFVEIGGNLEHHPAD